MHDNLENRLEAAGTANREASLLPDVVAARVRRCGRVRRAKIAAFGFAPVALAAGFVVTQFNQSPTPEPVNPGVGLAFAEEDFAGLIGWQQNTDVFSEKVTPGIVRASSGHVFRFRDTYDAATVDALFSGI